MRKLGKLSYDRRILLDKIGFVWSAEQVWQGNFEQLCLFHNRQGRDAVKEHWDVGVPFKDGITARETCQTSEKHNWKESVSLLPDMEYIRFYLL